MTTESREVLTWKMAFDRSLIWRRGGSVRYLVVEIDALELARQPEKTREPLNLALVIDASGSMEGRPLECAKAAVAGVVEQLRAEDRVAITSFADDSVVHFENMPLDAAGKARAQDMLRELNTRGCTNLAAGWLDGCECAARVMAQSLATRGRVVLLSDGHANRGEQEPSRLAKIADDLRMRGVYTSTVGIGDGYSPVQLEAISEHGGGRMHDAERPEEIIEVVLGELGEAVATVADDIQLELTYPSDVQCECMGSWPVSQGKNCQTVSAGALIGGASRRLIFKITAPSGQEGEVLAFTAGLKWLETDGKTRITSQPQEVSLKFVRSEANSSQPRDVDLSLIVARTWQSEIVRRVTQWNREGEYVQAETYVREQSRWFERYCQGLPGAEALVEQLQRVERTAGHAWSERARKEIRLQHHKQTRQEADYRAVIRPNWDKYLD